MARLALVRPTSAGLFVYSPRGVQLGLVKSDKAAKGLATKSGLGFDPEASQVAPTEDAAERAARAVETRTAIYDWSEVAGRAVATKGKKGLAAAAAKAAETRARNLRAAKRAPKKAA
jgi:hypothetical protein